MLISARENFLPSKCTPQNTNEENKGKQLLKPNKPKQRKIPKPRKPKMLKIKPCLDFLNPPLELKPSSSLPLLRVSMERDPGEMAEF